MKIVIADDQGEHDHIGIPPGGLTGQVLKKIASTDHDVEWGYATGSGAAWGTITGTLADQTDLQGKLDGIHQLPAGGTTGQVLRKASNDDYNVEWAMPSAGGSIVTLKKTANQTINAGAGTYTDITGLTFPVVSGTDYAFYFYIVFRSAALTTGWKASVNHPGGTVDHFSTIQTIVNNAAGLATWLQRHNTAVNDMTLLLATPAINVDLVVMIQGRYLCTSNGTFAARFANELANTDIVVQKGSWGWYF